MALKDQLLQLTQTITRADADDEFALTVLSSKILVRMAELGLLEGIQKTTDAALKAERQAQELSLEAAKRDSYKAGRRAGGAAKQQQADHHPEEDLDLSEFDLADI